ncbi:MAG: hypothetical protein ABR898_09660 [Terracidiphilus sp.]
MRWIVTDNEAATHLDAFGLRVAGVTITSGIRFEFCKIPFCLQFTNCTFKQLFSLISAELPALYLMNCLAEQGIFADGLRAKGSIFFVQLEAKRELRLLDAQIGGVLNCSGATLTAADEALIADRANIAGSVVLSNKFSSTGKIRLNDAQIGGDLNCSGATLKAKGDGLIADGARIIGDVHCTGGFSSSGRTRFPGAQIGGDLDCSGATLNAEGDALLADDTKITGNLILGDKFFSRGRISLTGAQVGGDLDCSGATLRAKVVALSADRAKIAGDIHLSRRFSSVGTISLVGTRIGGALDCSGAIFGGGDSPSDGNTSEWIAILAVKADIANGVFFTDKFSSSGAIRLQSSQIGGDLNCSGATLTSRKNTLYADGARISGKVQLVGGFSSSGTINLPGAQIDGSLDCSGAHLTAEQTTVYADGARIGQSVFLRERFFSSTTVRFNGAKIGGDLDCTGARIGNLECKGLQTGGDLICTGIQWPEAANLDLSNSSFARLQDDSNCRPSKGHLKLDGLVYRDFVLPAGTTPGMVAEDRIVWLGLQPKEELNKPQPWMQVAKVLEANGNSDGAKRVIYVFRRQQASTANPFYYLASLINDKLEEQPMRILFPIVLLWLFGFVIFWRARRMKAMAPKDSDACKEFRVSGEIPEEYVPFSAAMYTLENVLPVVKLGQDDAWGPNPQAKPASWFPGRPYLAWTRWLPGMNYPWLAILRWTIILLGWALALILAAAISERFK